MPTKVPEYMASGTPILVFAHKTTALYKYAKETEWAYTVSDNNINSIAEAIERIYKDELLRKTLNKKAINIVKTNHDANIIRKKFKETLLIGIENIN